MPLDSTSFWTGQRHGGDLDAAAAAYGIPATDWLDLSTGINPNGWPLPALDQSLVRRLPMADGALERAARAYYGGPLPLAGAGSQALIAVLPWLRPPGRVALPRPGYREHELAWRRAGHRPRYYDPGDPGTLAELINSRQVDSAIVIQPHNPLGLTMAPADLVAYSRALAQRGGVLIIDEAFADTEPDCSLAESAAQPGLVVLRSLGKFFGLAGLRLGFALAEPRMVRRLRTRLGPWAVSGPARYYGEQALRDRDWQRAARLWLAARSGQMEAWLAAHLDTRGQPANRASGVQPVESCRIVNSGLFVSVETELRTAIDFADRHARQGILLRVYPGGWSSAGRSKRAVLRIGLPDDDGWSRLAAAPEFEQSRAG